MKSNISTLSIGITVSVGLREALSNEWIGYIYITMKPQEHRYSTPKTNMPSYLKWQARLLLSIAVGVIVYTIIWLSSQFDNPPGWSWLALLLLLMTYLTFEVVSRVLHHLSKLDLVKGESLNMVIAVLLAILSGVLAYCIMFYGFKWIDHWVEGSEPPYMQHMFMAALVGLSMSVVFAFIQLGFNWRSQFFKSQLENEQFKAEIAQANLSILKNQLDPHFMFNNFNTLYYLIEEDTELARSFLKNISTIYRFILQNNDKALIPAREEYDMAKQYLAVIQHRYQNLLTLEDHIAPASLEKMDVPPLVLQQLIENAIKHNRIDEKSPLSLSFTSSKGYLTVRNNMNPKRPEHTAKTGLKNMARRYEYLTSQKMMVLESNGEFSVSIPLIAANA